MRHITFQDDVFQEENGSRLQISSPVNISGQSLLNKNTKYLVFRMKWQSLNTSFLSFNDILF